MTGTSSGAHATDGYIGDGSVCSKKIGLIHLAVDQNGVALLEFFEGIRHLLEIGLIALEPLQVALTVYIEDAATDRLGLPAGHAGHLVVSEGEIDGHGSYCP